MAMREELEEKRNYNSMGAQLVHVQGEHLNSQLP
ncbi:unnamed protein product [Linum tenue]|uniref:Uncharacterized protein n=1 Tax=Linum tenue TaxID=586396 RepID=A0AAV0IXH5_9ROSI|nr:unnamed protein product [Linum tenue]